MKRLGSLLLKNAAANMVRGLATAVVSLTLPHFLTHALDPDRFAAWSLILQIASYASFLDFGLQTAVARFLAKSTAQTDSQTGLQTGNQPAQGEPSDRRSELLSTAVTLLSCAGVLAFLIILLVLWQVSRFFPGVPMALLPEFRLAACVLALGACLSLPLSTYTGVLLGLHRNEHPALCIGTARLLGALAVVLTARHTHSLILLALCLSLTNVLGGVAQFAVVGKLLPTVQFAFQRVRRGTALQLTRYCAGLSVWSLMMLLVSGLDVSLVGHFRFQAVGVYSVAATLSLFFAGLNQSVIGALMTPIAVLHARAQREQIRSLVLRVTRLNAVGNLVLTCACLAGGPVLLRFWVGAAYARQAYPLLSILIVAQAIRLIANPYAVTLIAVGQQARGLMPAVSEAALNLVVSVAGVVLLGPIGVAAGTLTGACAGVAVLLTRTVPGLEPELLISRRDLLREGFFRPGLTALPLAVSLAAGPCLGRWTVPLALLGAVATAALLYCTERRPASAMKIAPSLFPSL